ncbi:NAD-dependent epimerase/dehydratase family protein [Acidisphaera rubrifaciens]|uniref:NAD dependent epimerase/dehydratase n=1 Tax=Acidisphaera rubrifaciens HS-AP3 TaxID=1231350 RepID=A0A0D6P6A9_9PROT|nr:NAD-dependent epimerase/dehydratase family protein [Acidisphaera rubrifaciens]GAN76733.1 NAD dependent epimerase/dehydratase [Acidisphaera rubrifaciens HS-AP3]
MDAMRSSLFGRKVVVTGGAGFIGSHTIDLLIDRGCREIVAVDDMVRGRPENLLAAMARGPVRLVTGDIRDNRLMRTVLAGSELVLHMAALRITQCAVEPRRAMEVMVDATYDLLESCVALGVGKVVIASSASIYGMAETFPTPESHHPWGNRTLYGVAKTFCEGILRVFNETHGLDYVALRYFNAYGPRMDMHGRYTEVLIRWMERIENGLPPIIFGDGSQTMDMVHGCDIARANVLAAESAATDVVLNVGTGQETSLYRLAGLLAEVMGRPDLHPVHEPERLVNPVPRRLAATDAARAAIGFTASITVREGLGDLVAWWRRNRLPVASAL